MDQPTIRRRTHVAVSTKGVKTWDYTLEIIEPLEEDKGLSDEQLTAHFEEHDTMYNMLVERHGLPGVTHD